MSGSNTPSPARGGRCGLVLLLVAAVVAALLMFLVIVLLAHPTCGCTTLATPYDGPSPSLWPVSASQAAAAAKSFTGVEMGAAAWAADDSPLYEVTARGSYAFVDAWTGRVLEVFSLDQMPASVSTTADSAAAEATALVYLNRAGVSTATMTNSVHLVDRMSGAYFDVAWKDAGGVSGPEVLVNPTTETVFAFADMGFAPKHRLQMPVVGQRAATNLAESSTYSAGEQAISADFQITPGPSGRPEFQWLVVLNDAVLGVDAVTGRVSVLKSAMR